MRVGVVGVGRIGVLHAGTLADDPRVDALVVADLDRRARRAGAPRAGYRRPGVFCEKPLAGDLAGTREVLAHANAAGVPLQAGFQRRFGTSYRYRDPASGQLDGGPLPVDLAANAAGLDAGALRATTVEEQRGYW